MMNVLKKGVLFLVLYGIFTTYLFLASNRMEYLDNRDDEKILNVSINYGEWYLFYDILTLGD